MNDNVTPILPPLQVDDPRTLNWEDRKSVV